MNFSKWIKIENKEKILKNFKEDLKNIQNLKKEKIKEQHYSGDIPNINLVLPFYIYAIKSYQNVIYFRLNDLCTTLLSTLDLNNYTSTIVIHRSIFETHVMNIFRLSKLKKIISKKQWFDLYVELYSIIKIPRGAMLSNDDDNIKEKELYKSLPSIIKKIHINDAIRNISEMYKEIMKCSNDEKKEIEKMHFKLYGFMSEFLHPTNINKVMYENMELPRKTKRNSNIELDLSSYESNFSTDSNYKTVFSFTTQMLEAFVHLRAISTKIFNKCTSEIEKMEKEILEYQNSGLFQKELDKFKPIIEDFWKNHKEDYPLEFMEYGKWKD